MEQNDLMALSIAVQDYIKQSENYHFYNWELDNLYTCEKIIDNLVDKYQMNASALQEIARQLSTISKYPPRSLIQKVEDKLNNRQELRFDFGEQLPTYSEDEIEGPQR